MASEREVYIYAATLLENASFMPEEMFKCMKRVIELDPVLSYEERNLLSVVYKNALTEFRKALRDLENHFNNTEIPTRKKFLCEYKAKLLGKLHAICDDLINLIDDKLIPSNRENEAIAFFEKLKADYFRYKCEFLKEDERQEFAAAAQDGYEKAIKIVKEEIHDYHVKSFYLGLMLNYSVFLYEIVDNKDDAITLSKNALNEFESRYDDQANCEHMNEAMRESKTIADLLGDNIALWEDNRNFLPSATGVKFF